MKATEPKTQPPYPGEPTAQSFRSDSQHFGKSGIEEHPTGAIIWWDIRRNFPTSSGHHNIKVLVRCARCKEEFWKGVNHFTLSFTGGCRNCYSKIGKDRNRHYRNFKGRIEMKEGYVLAHIDTFSPEEQAILRPMLKPRQHTLSNYVLEHRAVMALHLGRPLKGKREIVHHLNGIKGDNRIANLELLAPNQHPHHDAKKARARIRKLEAEIRRLRKVLETHGISC